MHFTYITKLIDLFWSARNMTGRKLNEQRSTYLTNTAPTAPISSLLVAAGENPAVEVSYSKLCFCMIMKYSAEKEQVHLVNFHHNVTMKKNRKPFALFSIL